MRTMVKENGQWVTAEAPTSPKELRQWLWEHDGEDAVISDDSNGIYYCGNYDLMMVYRSKGKNAQVFPVLDNQLRASMY